MLVTLTEDVNTYDGRHKRGEQVDLNPKVAQAFIRQGKAKEVTATAPKRETLDNKMGKDMQTESSVAEKEAAVRTAMATPPKPAAQNRPHTATHRPPRTS